MSRVFEALEKARQERHDTIGGHEEAARLAPAAVVFPREKFDHNGKNGSSAIPIRSWRDTIEEFLFGRDLRNHENYPLVALEKGSPASEQYKILREQLRRLRTETNAHCLSITSPVKRDGKSTVSANLAVAVALDHEEQVLLIDCDLRNPQLHNYFRIPRTPGLSDYLTANSNAKITDYVQKTSIAGLEVITAGKPTSVSSELLGSARMDALMKELRLMFSRHEILIDSPPVLSTSDPLVLARQVDGIIMVIRAGKTPRDCLPEALNILKSNKIVGVVLNGAELGISSKYYYY